MLARPTPPPDDTGFAPVRATVSPSASSRHAQVLLAGAILAPGARTVSSALLADGLRPTEVLPPLTPGEPKPCQLGWSRKVSGVLWGLLVEAFACPKDLLWWLASTRPWRDASARRLRPGASTGPVTATQETFVKSSSLLKANMGLRDAVGGGPLGF